MNVYTQTMLQTISISIIIIVVCSLNNNVVKVVDMIVRVFHAIKQHQLFVFRVVQVGLGIFVTPLLVKKVITNCEDKGSSSQNNRIIHGALIDRFVRREAVDNVHQAQVQNLNDVARVADKIASKERACV